MGARGEEEDKEEVRREKEEVSRRLDRRHIPLVVHVALFERQTRIATRHAFGCGCGKRDHPARIGTDLALEETFRIAVQLVKDRTEKSPLIAYICPPYRPQGPDGGQIPGGVNGANVQRFSG